MTDCDLKSAGMRKEPPDSHVIVAQGGNGFIDKECTETSRIQEHGEAAVASVAMTHQSPSEGEIADKEANGLLSSAPPSTNDDSTEDSVIGPVDRMTAENDASPTHSMTDAKAENSPAANDHQQSQSSGLQEEQPIYDQVSGEAEAPNTGSVVNKKGIPVHDDIKTNITTDVDCITVCQSTEADVSIESKLSTLPADMVTVSESKKAGGSIIVMQNGQSASIERAASPIVIDDESDDDNCINKRNPKRGVQSSFPRKTRLECSFIDGSFCCVTCDYKTPSNISFASHVVIHLHRASDSGIRLCNVCKCDKIIDVVKNCHLVRNMMKLLVQQKNKWKQEQVHRYDTVPVIITESEAKLTACPLDKVDECDISLIDADLEQMSDSLTYDKGEMIDNSGLIELSSAKQDNDISTGNSSGNAENQQTPEISEISPVPQSRPQGPSTSKKASTKKALKIIYENGLFKCKTCNFVSDNELTFRKHLWRDLHRKTECSHCPSTVQDKFAHCKLLGEFMKHMFKNHRPKSPRTVELQSVKDTDEVPVATGGTSCNSVDSSNTENSEELSSVQGGGSKSHEVSLQINASVENDINRTLAMLDGLNQAQNINLPTGSASTDGSVIAGEVTESSCEKDDQEVDRRCEKDDQEVDRRGMACNGAARKSNGYTCPDQECCGWTTLSQTQFQTHMETKHCGMTAMKCASCFQMFENLEGLVCHIDSHHMTYDKNKFLFRCCFDGCEFSSNVVIDFRVHNIIKHKNATSFKCCHCSQSFDTTETLISHIQSNILNLAQCTICRCTSTNKNIITKHIKTDHPGEPRKIQLEVYICCQPGVFTAHIPDEDTSEGTASSIILRHKETTYLCPCEFVAKDIYAFKEHINSCNVHRKKTIYVVPPTVRCIQAPGKEECVSNTATVNLEQTERTEWSVTGATDLDEEHGDNEHGLPQENTEASEFVIADKTLNQMPAHSEDQTKPNSFDAGVAIDAVSKTDVGLPRLPEDLPQSFPLPKPIPTVFDQLGANQDMTCEKCCYVTSFDKFIESHKMVHNSSKDTSQPFACPLCPYSTTDEASFVFHFNCHQGRKILRVYQCKYCSLTSNQNDFIEDHLLNDHPDEDIRFECAPRKLDSVQCPECDMKFPAEKELLGHVRDEHCGLALKSYAERVYGLILEYCHDEEGLNKGGQINCPEAVSTSTGNLSSEVVISISPIPENEVNASEGYLSCTYCSYATHDIAEWKLHLKKHIGVGSLQVVMYCCRMCDWPSNDSKRVIDHCMKEHFMSGEQARDGGYETNHLEISNQVSGRKFRSDMEEAACDMPSGVSIEKYHCDVCDFGTNEKAALSKHKLENHGTIEDEDDEYESCSPPTRSSKSGCMKLANNLYGTRYPTQVGSRDKYICSMCPYTTDKAKHWHCHKVTHEKQMAIVNGLKCGYCKTLATKLNTMRYHHNRYHGNQPHKFFKVANGAVSNELVVSPDDMVSIGPPYQISLPSNSLGDGLLLKELLTLQRRQQPRSSVKLLSGGFEEDDDSGESVNGNDVVEEEEVESNEEYQEETHILTNMVHPQDDPSKYCCKIPGKDMHQCLKCHYTHKYPSKVLRHFRYRHEKFCPYRCGYCPFTSVESPKIRRHIHIMHKQMPVKILGTSSESPYAEATEEFRAERAATLGVQEDLEYIVHKFISKGDNNLQCCLLCGYKQEGASSLKRHLFAVHLQYYPYKCKYCDVTAIERNKIVKHLEKVHPSLEMRLVRLKFKGPLPEIPHHLKEIVGTDSVPGTSDKTWKSGFVSQADDQSAGLGLRITNVASVTSRINRTDLDDVNWSNSYAVLGREKPTSAQLSLNSEMECPTTRVKEEPDGDGTYGMMPSNVSIRDDDEEEEEEGEDDDSSFMDQVGDMTGFRKGDIASGIVVPHPNQNMQLKNVGAGDAVHKMCMYCNYTTRWNIGDVKTHILVTHLKRYPYGCKFCGFTGRDKKKLKIHCRSEHPQALPGTGFKYLYNEYANILVVRKIGKEMYIGVKGLDSLEAVEKASQMTMQELKVLAGTHGVDDPDNAEHPVPLIKIGRKDFSKGASGDPADAVIKKHQLQLQQQLKSMVSSSATEEPLDLSVATDADALGDGSKMQLSSMEMRPGSESGVPHELTNKHLQCRKCGYVHFDMYKLKVHILSRHLKIKPYTCSSCGYDDFASHKVTSHVTEVHGDANAVMIRNIIQRDAEIKKYVGHVDTSKKLVRPYVRTVEMDPNIPKPFECGHCGYQARSRAKVKYHSIRKHKHMEVKVLDRNGQPSDGCSPSSAFTPVIAKSGSIQLQPSSKQESQDSMMLSPGVSIEANHNFTCSKCFQPFASEEDLEDHEAKVHAVIGVYQCVYCPSRQRHQYKMKQHQRLKHPQDPIKMVLIHVDEAQHRKKSSPVIPIRPPKQFAMNEPLSARLHVKKVLNGVYQCSHCPSRISYKSKMNWHQRVKHPHLPASFQFMPNELSDKAKAMAAKRAKIVVPDWRSKLGRLGTKPLQENMYRCKACNFSTKDQFNMRNHAQAHTGYRPYRCPYCAYGNVKSFPVKMHVRKHHPGMAVKHKVERDHVKEAELRQMYSSPVRKSKHRIDSSRQGPPPKKRMIEFSTSGFGASGEIIPKEEPKSDDESQSTNETNAKPYCCILCGHWSSNHTGIKRHLMWEIKYKPYACPHCAYRDVYANAIEVHCGKVHKEVPVESLYRRDAEKEAYIQNLIEQSRKKQNQQSVSSAGPDSKGHNGRMSINTLKIIKRHGKRATVLNKCKECGFITTKPKHMSSHVVRHGPKRHQCGYCEFQAFYPYEIQHHSSKFHPSLPIMSTLLGNRKPGQELVDVIKMTGHELEDLLKGKIPTPSTSGVVEIPLGGSANSCPNGERSSPIQQPPPVPDVAQHSPPVAKTVAQQQSVDSKQLLMSPTVSPMIDGLRIPESEFHLNERGNYQCRHCDYENEALQHYKNHLIKHMPPRWKCFYCKCMTQLSYDLRKHIKNFHPGNDIKIVKLDPNLHPPHTFKPSRTGIAFTINLRDWKELLQGTAPPGRKDTDTVVVTEEDYTHMIGGGSIPIKQEAFDDYEDGNADPKSFPSGEDNSMSENAPSSLCLNCCYCAFSTHDTSIYAAHLQTHSTKSFVNTEASYFPVLSHVPQADKNVVSKSMASGYQPRVEITDIMELDPVALEGLLHGSGVTSIRF